jgi:hypothetical protein
MKTKATQQITEITFNEASNPFIAKRLAENNVSTCDYFYKLNLDKAQEFESKIIEELESNPESSSPKLGDWEQELVKAEAQMDEWKEERSMIVKQIVAVYPDYVPKGKVTKSSTDLVAQAKARFAKK